MDNSSSNSSDSESDSLPPHEPDYSLCRLMKEIFPILMSLFLLFGAGVWMNWPSYVYANERQAHEHWGYIQNLSVSDLHAFRGICIEAEPMLSDDVYRSNFTQHAIMSYFCAREEVEANETVSLNLEGMKFLARMQRELDANPNVTDQDMPELALRCYLQQATITLNETRPAKQEEPFDPDLTRISHTWVIHYLQTQFRLYQSVQNEYSLATYMKKHPEPWSNVNLDQFLKDTKRLLKASEWCDSFTFKHSFNFSFVYCGDFSHKHVLVDH